MNDRFKLKDIYYKTEVVKTSTNNNWNGGVYVAGGYAKVKVKEHPAKDKRGYVLLHRLVMEDYLGRYLKDDEFIHHKDGNKLNATEENLEIVSESEHQSFHNKDKKLSENHKAKISEANQKRKGIKMKKIDIPDLKTLLTKGFSVSEIAKKYSLSWSTVKSKAVKIHENADLLEVKDD